MLELQLFCFGFFFYCDCFIFSVLVSMHGVVNYHIAKRQKYSMISFLIGVRVLFIFSYSHRIHH